MAQYRITVTSGFFPLAFPKDKEPKLTALVISSFGEDNYSATVEANSEPEARKKGFEDLVQKYTDLGYEIGSKDDKTSFEAADLSVDLIEE